jgi:hypothetical protein
MAKPKKEWGAGHGTTRTAEQPSGSDSILDADLKSGARQDGNSTPKGVELPEWGAGHGTTGTAEHPSGGVCNDGRDSRRAGSRNDKRSTPQGVERVMSDPDGTRTRGLRRDRAAR